MTDLLDPPRAAPGDWLADHGAADSWTLHALLRDGHDEPLLLSLRLRRDGAELALASFAGGVATREWVPGELAAGDGTLRLAGDAGRTAWSVEDGAMRVELEAPGVSARLALTGGLDPVPAPGSRGYAIERLSASGTVALAGGDAAGVAGTARVERGWAGGGERWSWLEGGGTAPLVTPAGARALGAAEPAFRLRDVGVAYGAAPAVRGVTLDVPARAVTALIGPSGAGKSTLIRVLNRMNDLVDAATVTGEVAFRGQDLYAADVDPVQVRKRIGMVFQKPNPFPKSIYDNVAFGPRTLRMDGDLDARVEQALRRAALWDEVKDRLGANAFGLSGGQQQRLIIARALATNPEVLLMDEPASALDPFSTARVEDLMLALREELTIVVVTHNMQQAGRVADMTAFMTVVDGAGALVEFDTTEAIFTAPRDPRTEAYVTGRFG